jgi:hypothetical protein
VGARERRRCRRVEGLEGVCVRVCARVCARACVRAEGEGPTDRRRDSREKIKEESGAARCGGGGGTHFSMYFYS